MKPAEVAATPLAPSGTDVGRFGPQCGAERAGGAIVSRPRPAVSAADALAGLDAHAGDPRPASGRLGAAGRWSAIAAISTGWLGFILAAGWLITGGWR